MNNVPIPIETHRGKARTRPAQRQGQGGRRVGNLANVEPFGDNHRDSEQIRVHRVRSVFSVELSASVV